MARKLVFSNGEHGKEMPVSGPVIAKEVEGQTEAVWVDGQRYSATKRRAKSALEIPDREQG